MSDYATANAFPDPEGGTGINVRTYIAAKALQGLLANPSFFSYTAAQEEADVEGTVLDARIDSAVWVACAMTTSLIKAMDEHAE